jgi:hypothetical protein
MKRKEQPKTPALVDLRETSKRGGIKPMVSPQQIAKLRKGDIAIVLAHDPGAGVPAALELRITQRERKNLYGRVLGMPGGEHKRGDLVVFQACNIHDAISTKRKDE